MVSSQWGLKQGQRAAVRNVVGKWVPQETAVYREWKLVGVHSSQFALESEVMRSCREGVETVIVIKIQTVKFVDNHTFDRKRGGLCALAMWAISFRLGIHICLAPWVGLRDPFVNHSSRCMHFQSSISVIWGEGSRLEQRIQAVVAPGLGKLGLCFFRSMS